MCENGKIRPIQTIPGMGEGGQRRMMEGVNWTMIYCKNNNMIKTEKNTSSKLNKMDLFIETIKEKTHVNQHG
jgi:hypothetical protein